MELRIKDLDDSFKRDFETLKSMLGASTNKKAIIDIVQCAKNYIYINKDTQHENEELRAQVKKLLKADQLKTEAIEKLSKII